MYRWVRRCCVVLIAFGVSFNLPAGAQNDLLPDLTFHAPTLAGNEIDTNTIPGQVLLRFDSSLPNIGAGELRLESTGVDSGDGRFFVSQRIMLDNMSTRTQDAGDFLYNPVNTSMEVAGWVSYRVREVLAGNGVGAILGTGQKTSVHISSSAIFDASLPNVPPFNMRIVASGGVHGISVGYTDLYQRFFNFQWVNVTGLPSGEYWLEVEVDPGNHILEEDDSNNVARLKIMLDLPDDDADGLSTTFEQALGLNENDPDSDGDGLDDGEEVGYDGDASDYDPFNATTNPTGTDTDALNPDTDADGALDGPEVNLGLNPLGPGDGGQLDGPHGPILTFLIAIIMFFASFFLRST